MINRQFDFSVFFEMSPDLVCIAGKDGYFKNVNAAVLNKLGYSREELFSRPISEYIYEADKALTRKTRAEMIAGTPLLNFINRYVTKSGELIWLEWTSIYYPETEIVFAIAKDITIRRKAELQTQENYIKFKGLASHFKFTMEKDRKYLAYELHEELAQLISVLKMDVEYVSNHSELLPLPVKERVADAISLSSLIIKTIQRISFSLSPGMLEDFGLDATIEWLCAEFSLLQSISCRFESNYEEEDLTQEVRVDFFRICQEALSTVFKKGEQNNILIRIYQAGDRICLNIHDSAQGFAIDTTAHPSLLAGIRERTSSINGQIKLHDPAIGGSGFEVCVMKDAEKMK